MGEISDRRLTMHCIVELNTKQENLAVVALAQRMLRAYVFCLWSDYFLAVFLKLCGNSEQYHLI